MSAHQWVRRAVVGLVTVSLVAACGDDDDASDGTDAGTTEAPSGAATSAAPADTSAAAATTTAESSAGTTEGGGGESSGEPFIIGYSNSLSQVIGPVVTGHAAGMRTALYDLNQAGGLDGRKIEIDLIDDALDPARTQVNIEGFIDDGAIMLVCCPLASQGQATVLRAEEEEIPMMSYSALPELLSNPWVFINRIESGAQAGNLAGNFIVRLAEERGIAEPRVANINFEGGNGPPFAEQLRAVMDDNGGSVVAEETLPLTSTEAEAQARAALEQDPDFVALTVGGLAPAVVSALRSRGFEGPIINYEGAGQTSSGETAIQDEEYYVARVVRAPDETDFPDVAEMVAKADAAGETDNMLGVDFTLGYIWGLVTLDAVQECGVDCTGADLQQALYDAASSVDTGELSVPVVLSHDNKCMYGSAIYYHWSEADGHTVPSGDPVEAQCFAE